MSRPGKHVKHKIKDSHTDRKEKIVKTKQEFTALITVIILVSLVFGTMSLTGCATTDEAYARTQPTPQIGDYLLPAQDVRRVPDGDYLLLAKIANFRVKEEGTAKVGPDDKFCGSCGMTVPATEHESARERAEQTREEVSGPIIFADEQP
jgi:hypothetical protein